MYSGPRAANIERFNLITRHTILCLCVNFPSCLDDHASYYVDDVYTRFATELWNATTGIFFYYSGEYLFAGSSL